jgi:hypothetical protein
MGEPAGGILKRVTAARDEAAVAAHLEHLRLRNFRAICFLSRCRSLDLGRYPDWVTLRR